jgi:small subunit ribosomal protein S16
MLVIRLQRVGRKNDPSFRVVVTDSKNSAKSGKFLEVLGAYDPRKQSGKIQLTEDRIKHWISMGAKPSDTVHNLLISKKVITGEKINPVPKKPVAPEPAPEAAKPEAPAEEIAPAPEAPTEVVTEEVVTPVVEEAPVPVAPAPAE